MTPLHNSVKTAILPVLLETTTIARENRAKITKVKDEVYKNVEREYKILHKILGDEWGNSNRLTKGLTQSLLGLVAAASNRPDLLNIAKSNGSYAPLDPFTIIVPTDLSDLAVSYGLIVGLPCLVTHGIDKVLLSPDAHLVEGAYDLGGQYKCYPATDVEVEQWVDSLTPAQLRWIVGNEMFAPYLEDIFNPPVAPPTNPELLKLINPEEPPAF